MDTTLAELMKQYEHAHRRRLSRNDYVLVRADGKNFHNYTKHLQRPYDLSLMEAMDQVTLALCENIPGVRFAYVESDEISLLISAFRTRHHGDRTPPSELWMGGVEAKIVSLTGALASVTFEQTRRRQAEALRLTPGDTDRFHRSPALFDARVWSMPGNDEGRDLVRRYLNWRHRDSIKNSVTMAALASFSHREIHGMRTEAKRERLAAIGAPWEALPAGFRFGRFASKHRRKAEVTFRDGRTGELSTTMADRAFWKIEPLENVDAVLNSDTLPHAEVQP